MALQTHPLTPTIPALAATVLLDVVLQDVLLPFVPDAFPPPSQIAEMTAVDFAAAAAVAGVLVDAPASDTSVSHDPARYQSR